MIWKIRFWNMKKIGKKKINVPDMISTFRAFATSVRELKKEQKKKLRKGEKPKEQK